MKKIILSLLVLFGLMAGAEAQNDIPLTFEAIEAGTVALEKVGDFTPNSWVQYRLGETGDWSSYSYGTGISLQAGQKLQFRSTSTDSYSMNGNNYSHFTCTADCYLYGSVGALFNNANSLPGNACSKMFYGNTHIKNCTGKSLVLPATSLGNACYEEMFYGCTNLTTAPELPATSLASICYNGMFSGCTALTTAPKLPAATLAPGCYREMFSGCTALTTAPTLPATSLVYDCYKSMFSGCTSLTTAPALPATSLDYDCYKSMFSGCTSLNYMTCLATDISAMQCTEGWLSGVASTGTFFKAPEMEDWPTGDSGIPTGWTVEDFFDTYSTPLTFEAIAAGTVTLEKKGDFTPNSGVQYRMNETGDWLSYTYGTGINLQVGDKLQFCSTSSVAYSIDEVYYSHFTCTADCYLYGSVGALFNNSNSLPENACSRMFFGNTHIKNHTDKRLVLPATSVSKACYEEMFSGCTSLTSAPELPATSLANFCYKELFSGCTNLTTAPELPATSLAEFCYLSMFSGCTSLTSAPELPATSLALFCYNGMFSGCTNLNHVICLATDISASGCTTGWLSGVAPTGTFIKTPEMEDWPTGDSGIPAGWTVEDHNPFINPLTFQAVEAGTITVKLDDGANLDPIQYRLNGGAWTNVAWNTPIALSTDDVIRFRGNNGTCYDETNQAGFRFACSNNCYVYGNLMSLIDQYGFETDTTLTQSRAFYRLFQTSEPNTTLLSHPYHDIFMPATTLTPYCYCGLFANCQGITRAPVLPATTMQEGCYFEMFYECAALTTPPALPATTLAGYCYYNMFAGCTSLATAPTLPATTIASNCYYNMFSRCTNLTAAPELPATQLQDRCYSGMFQGCTNLTTASTLPATTLAENCYYNMFSGCTNLTAAPALPATQLQNGCYHGMFNGCIRLTTAPALPATTLKNNCYYGMFQDCKGLTTAPALPATTLANHCYDGMFNGCTALTTAPALPATTLTDYCYYEMFRGCTALTTAPALPATTLSDYCYQRMFYNCSNLNYVVCLATDISASDCTKNWLSSVANSGTFVKDPDMTNWSSGKSGIPSGWNVININKFTADGDWNVAANWSNNAVPAAGSNVVIAANVMVPSEYVADAGSVFIEEGNTLTIADGGQLKHSNEVQGTIQKFITGYGDVTNPGGYYLLGAPINMDSTVAVRSGMVDLVNGHADFETHGIDLYEFSQGQIDGLEWLNMRFGNNFHTFGLLFNEACLYARADDAMLNISTTENKKFVPTSVDESIMVMRSVSTPEPEFIGWNLIRNPYTCNTYLTTGRDFYRVNAAGDAIVLATSENGGSAIKPCEGFFVVVGEHDPEQTIAHPYTGNTMVANIQMTTTEPQPNESKGMLDITVKQEGQLADVARVRFGEGEHTRKLMLRNDATHLSITCDNKEYSVVHNESQGELHLNFKASRNGQYIINTNLEQVEMGYLHLIDNMTGADIDLLTTPTYTFNAKTTDYASRFRLVFVARSVFGDEDSDDEHFAFISNGSWIIANEGQATLQVIDLTGRVLCSEHINGSVSKDINAVPGVYMIRLINGENVRTQKIVIR